MKQKSSIAVQAGKAEPSATYTGGQNGSKPLDGRSIYLDLFHHKNSMSFEKKLKLLGATIEKCFSRDVAFVITNRGRASDFESKAPRSHTLSSHAAIAARNAVISPSSPNLFQLANPHLCHGLESSPSCSPNTPDGSVSRPVTRGQAIALKANLTKNYGSTDILRCAQLWGIKIVHMDRAENWIDKEMKKLPKQQKGKQQPKSTAKNLSETFIKVEDTKRCYCPMYGNLPAFPIVSTSCALGQTIFTNPDSITAAVPGKMYAIGNPAETKEIEACSTVLSSDADDFKPPRRPVSHSRQPCNDSGSRLLISKKPTAAAVLAPDGAKPMVTSAKVSIATAKVVTKPEVARVTGCIRDTQQQPPQMDGRRGYCEICKMRFANLQSHCRSHRHRVSVADSAVYRELDDIIADGLSIETLIGIAAQASVTSDCTSAKTTCPTIPYDGLIDRLDDSVRTSELYVEVSWADADDEMENNLFDLSSLKSLKPTVDNQPTCEPEIDRSLSPEIPMTPSPPCRKHQPFPSLRSRDVDVVNTTKNDRLSSGYGTSISKTPLSVVLDKQSNSDGKYLPVSPQDCNDLAGSSTTEQIDIDTLLSSPAFDWYMTGEMMLDYYFKTSEDGPDLFEGFQPHPDYDHISEMLSMSFSDLSSTYEPCRLSNCEDQEVDPVLTNAAVCLGDVVESLSSCSVEKVSQEARQVPGPLLPPPIASSELSVNGPKRDLDAVRPSVFPVVVLNRSDASSNYGRDVVKVDDDILFNHNSPQKHALAPVDSQIVSSSCTVSYKSVDRTRGNSTVTSQLSTPASRRRFTRTNPTSSPLGIFNSGGPFRKVLSFSVDVQREASSDASHSTDMIADSPSHNTRSGARLHCRPVIRLMRCDKKPRQIKINSHQ